MNWHNAGDAPPQLLVLPPAAASLDEAHAAIEQWEHYSGKTLDPPQRLTVEVMMAESSAGRWAARTTGREEPRQQGKGDEIEVVEFWGLTQRGEAILHTAHELNTVASAFQRMAALFSHKDFRGKRQPKFLNGKGQQEIEVGGAVVWYRTRTAGGGRGLDDISRLVVDEAQHAQREHLASATPTLLANPNPQINFVGTGGIAGTSGWWWELRVRALSPDPGDFGYVGHTAERVRVGRDGSIVRDPVDPADRSLWRAPNPALVYGRTEMAFLEEEFRILGPALFAREHLGVWDDPPTQDKHSIFDVRLWESLADPGAARGADVVFGVDVGEDRLAHVAVAWKRPDGRLHVMMAAARISPLAAPARIAQLVARWGGPVVVGGPSAGLDLGDLNVLRVDSGEFANACGTFEDLVNDGRVRHGNQEELNGAVRAARWRSVGSAGQRALQLRDAPAVGPLAAAVRAVWGVEHKAKAQRPEADFFAL